MGRFLRHGVLAACSRSTDPLTLSLVEVGRCIMTQSGIDFHDRFRYFLIATHLGTNSMNGVYLVSVISVAILSYSFSYSYIFSLSFGYFISVTIAVTVIFNICK